jgi:polyhydroxyalkanoate synthesis regulator phasin
MFDFIAHLDRWAQWLLAVGAAVALIAGFWRWLLPRWRNAKADARAIRDTLVGREAQRDSITGEEIQPAIPGIGTRVSSIEKQGQTTSDQLGILTRAVADMAASQERIDNLEHRVAAIEQGHFLERMAGKAESIQLFRTIEQVSKDNTDDDPAA